MPGCPRYVVACSHPFCIIIPLLGGVGVGKKCLNKMLSPNKNKNNEQEIKNKERLIMNYKIYF
jgi:hypothetical protein